MKLNIDKHGRTVIPKEIRQRFGIRARVTFIKHDGFWILRPANKGCIFCRYLSDLIEFKDYKVCRYCCEDMAKVFDTILWTTPTIGV